MADSLWSSVLILSHLDETDGSAINLGSAANNVSLNDGFDTTTKKFGAASATGEVDLVSTGSPTIDLPTDFTIECWFRWGANDTDCGLVKLDGTNGSVLTQFYLLVVDTGAVSLNITTFSLPSFTTLSFSTPIASSAGVLSANTFHHIALQRASGAVEVMLDGVSLGSFSDSTAFNDASTAFGLWDNFVDNFVDEIRVTSASRYTAPFTPPTAAFDNFAPTGSDLDGTSSGTATVSGIGASTAKAVGSSAGVATVSGALINKTPLGVGASAGVATVSGVIRNATQVAGWSDDLFFPPFTVWSFSPDQEIATCTPSATLLINEIRAANAKSSGRWYFEINSTTPQTSNLFGITQTGVSPGTETHTVGLNSSSVHVFGFAFDADTRQYWARLDGTWVTGAPDIGDPTGTLATGTQVPYVIVSSAGGSARVFTAQFATGTFSDPAPAGFTGLDDIPGEGSGAAAGAAVALGVGQTLVTATGTAATVGTSTAQAQGLQARTANAAAAGTAAAAATAVAAAVAAATAAGAGAASGIGRSRAAATASAAGTSTAQSGVFSELVATAAGTSSAAAASAARTAFSAGVTVRTEEVLTI